MHDDDEDAVPGADDAKHEIVLNVFDDDGNVVDTATSELTVARMADIIDHAAQLIILHRGDKRIGDVLAELDEALSVAGVLPYADGSPSPG